jgi:xanthine dehydrogenase iron-sulfur cluster and FAD-binding subunit A
VLAATALLERKPDASREDVLEALSGHVCRCTGYVKIVSAVEAAARGDVHPRQVEPSFEPEEAEVLIPGSPA